MRRVLAADVPSCVLYFDDGLYIVQYTMAAPAILGRPQGQAHAWQTALFRRVNCHVKKFLATKPYGASKRIKSMHIPNI